MCRYQLTSLERYFLYGIVAVLVLAIIGLSGYFVFLIVDSRSKINDQPELYEITIPVSSDVPGDNNFTDIHGKENESDYPTVQSEKPGRDLLWHAKTRKTCKNQSCVDLADRITLQMDPSVSPCTDFASFACGLDFVEVYMKGMDDLIDGRSGAASRIATETWNLDRELMERTAKELLKTAPIGGWREKAQTFYRSCRQSSHSALNYSEFGDRILRHFLSSGGHVDAFLGALRSEFAVGIFLDLYSSYTLDDAVDVYQNEMMFTHFEILRNWHLFSAEYQNDHRSSLVRRIGVLIRHSKDALTKLKIMPDDDAIEDFANQIFAFEKQIATMMVPLDKMSIEVIKDADQKTYSYRKLDERRQKSWSWARYLDGFNRKLKTAKFVVHEVVALENTLNYIHTVDRQFLTQYMVLRTQSYVYSMFYSMNEVALAHQLRHQGHLRSPIDVHRQYLRKANTTARMGLQPTLTKGSLVQQQRIPRTGRLRSRLLLNEPIEYDVCLKTTVSVFPTINVRVLHELSEGKAWNQVAVMWNGSYFEAKEMMRDIKAVLAKRLANATWLGNWRHFAAKKLHLMRFTQAFDDALLHDDVSDALFKDLSFMRDDYTENVLRYLKFYSAISLSSEHKSFMVDTSPLYVTRENTVSMQGLHLQSPNYDPSWPMAARFADMANPIAHEIGHAFDRAGWYFSPTGAYMPSSRWPSEFSVEWSKRVKCVHEFYSGERQWMASKQHVGEMIADKLGLELSFEAFKESIWRDGAERLPHLRHYSPEMLFFIELGRSTPHCMQEYGKDELLESGLTQYHLPSPFRLNFLLQQNSEFARVFNCKRGSPMNPERGRECKLI